MSYVCINCKEEFHYQDEVIFLDGDLTEITSTHAIEDGNYAHVICNTCEEDTCPNCRMECGPFLLTGKACTRD